MKKIFTLLIIGVSALFLVACGAKSVDGNWVEYVVDSETNEFDYMKDYSKMEIKGETGLAVSDGSEQEVAVNQETQVITSKRFSFNYTLTNDVLTLTNGEDSYYFVREDSETHKKFVKQEQE